MTAVRHADKVAAFHALHSGPDIFVMPNAWDAGSARILGALGFRAIGTTSAGLALALGRRDTEGSIARVEALENARAIAAAVDLPVSADLENGYGPRPEDVAVTIRLATAAGLSGGSIEDATTDRHHPIYDRSLAVERVAAAAEAVRRLPTSFVLTARAENFIYGRPDLDDTIARLNAYAEAGADVLYAPGLRDLETIRHLCGATSRPVNVLRSAPNPPCTVAELAEAGVRRVSLGGVLARVAMGAFLRAAEELVQHGTFARCDEAPALALLNRYIAPHS